jgi:hypothetical protein
VLIEPSNQAQASTKFFQETWRSSAAVKHLVTQRGAPEAISVEREFLQPNRLKLFYPVQGQVYILDLHEGEWFVSGSEPIVVTDFENLKRQQAASTSTLAHRTAIDQHLPVQVEPVSASHGSQVSKAPVGYVAPSEFRGRLKAPSAAAVASLTMVDSHTYVHTVTFQGENLSVLADWYTESEANASRLAAINRRPTASPLPVGDKIAIPRSLMRNAEPLPEAIVP